MNKLYVLLLQYYDDPSIKQYFDKKLNELRGKIVVFDLEALLIKPVQRILKYPLLLNELIKVLFCRIKICIYLFLSANVINK